MVKSENVSGKKRLKVLCISPSFVPMRDSEAFCGGKMIKALLSHHFETKVLCFDGYIADFDDSDFWGDLRGISVGVPVPIHVSRIRKLLCALKYRTYSWVRWVHVAVSEAVAMHASNRFDIVYSRSLPVVAHVVGYWASRKIGLPWVANIDDPWDWHLFPDIVQQRVPYYHSAISEYWLRKTLTTADLVTYPCERLRDYVVNLAGVHQKCEVIPHVGHSSEVRRDVEHLSFVHAGKLGVNEMTGRSAKGLLGGLNMFFERCPEARSAIKVTFVGPKDPDTGNFLKQLGLGDIVTQTGRVNYEESLKYIAGASVCVLIEGMMSEGIYLPSKLADYLVARKPVLALSPRVGVIADMAASVGLVRVDPDDKEGIANAIASFYKDFRQGSLPIRTPTDELVKQFEPQAVADKFLSAVSEVLKRKLL